MPRRCKNIALQAVVEVKLLNSATFALYIAELFSNHSLKLQSAYDVPRESVALLAHAAAVVSSHGGYFVVVDMALTMKMPSLKMATRWADEINTQQCQQQQQQQQQQQPPEKAASCIDLLKSRPPLGPCSKPGSKDSESRIDAFPVHKMTLVASAVVEQQEEVDKRSKAPYSYESALGSASSHWRPKQKARRTTELWRHPRIDVVAWLIWWWKWTISGVWSYT